jgi:elongation factor P hydroxylase
MHDCQDLIHIFNHCFAKKYNTRLVKGENEPLYQPANSQCPHHIISFAYGFFSSALHECSHWLIAGSARRQQVDYGYWYIPDGRTFAQQQSFQAVEVKPQALEWILSNACIYRFQFSIDNLTSSVADTTSFKQAVYQQVLTYYQQGLPKRARLFHQALLYYYGLGET